MKIIRISGIILALFLLFTLAVPVQAQTYAFQIPYMDVRLTINADGTADIAGATKIPNEQNLAMDGAMGISADGKKIGGAFPWPNVKILDVATGKLTDRHAGGFGCQANLAPDNSYRFFHCEGDHFGIMMFGSNLQDPTNWFVNLGINLAGVPNPNNKTVMDFVAPRWSNHVQYVTASYPMGDNHDSYFEGGQLWEVWGHSPDQVRSIKMESWPQVFIGKFSADFKMQEKSMLIASDPRYVQLGGDAWICSGTTYGNQCGSSSTSPAIRGDHPRGFSVVKSGASMETFSFDGRRLGPAINAMKRGVVIHRNKGAAISVRALVKL